MRYKILRMRMYYYTLPFILRFGAACGVVTLSSGAQVLVVAGGGSPGKDDQQSASVYTLDLQDGGAEWNRGQGRKEN